MWRTLFAVVSGVFASMIVITFVELANARLLYPPPPGIDWNDKAAVLAVLEAMPTAALAVVVSGWLLGALVGGGVAARIAVRHRTPAALAIGVLIVAGVIMNAMKLPHPAWVSWAGVLLPIPLAWLAARRVQKGLANTR